MHTIFWLERLKGRDYLKDVKGGGIIDQLSDCQLLEGTLLHEASVVHHLMEESCWNHLNFM
jgi:hypothetical protein